MYVLENEKSHEMYRQQGDIFLSRETLPEHIIHGLDVMEEIAHDSSLAKKELEQLPPQIVLTRKLGIRSLADKVEVSPEQWQAIAIIESLDERAAMYADLASMLQKHSLQIAEQLLVYGKFPVDLGGKKYWNLFDGSSEWLCSRDVISQEVILFNCWENVIGPGARIASFDDYIQLLKDVRRQQKADNGS